MWKMVGKIKYVYFTPCGLSPQNVSVKIEIHSTFFRLKISPYLIEKAVEFVSLEMKKKIVS